MGGLHYPSQDMNFINMVELINRTTMGTKAWGLSWTVIRVISWCVWKEQNARWKKGVYRSKEDILRQVIKITDVGFKATKFKKMKKSIMQVNTILKWDAYVLLEKYNGEEEIVNPS